MLQAGPVARAEEFRRLEVGRQRAHRALREDLAGDLVAPQIPPRDVVRVDERHRRAPRLGAALLPVPVGELPGDLRIGPPALAGPAVGRGVDAAGEAVALESPFAGERTPVVVA